MNECYFGDCREVLRKMIADGVKVNMCATSPPYWNLRDYGTATWEGGDAGCDHLQLAGIRQDVGRVQVNGFHGSAKPSELADKPYRDLCGKCGARRIDSQLGLEPTLAEFVANMVEVFGLVREVLADDGVLFLNLGDSYSTGGVRKSGYNDPGWIKTGGRCEGGAVVEAGRSGLKPKDLCGVPWRVALALQEAGWWLRQDIIWSKVNPMPESVTDRCTKSHEYVFLMTKSARYFYDAQAIAEPITDSTMIRNQTGWNGNEQRGYIDGKPQNHFSKFLGSDAAKEQTTRNKHSVWTIPSQAYSEAHFATFPEALVEPMILAGTSAHGHCPECGKGWVRVVERDRTVPARSGDWKATGQDHRNDIDRKGGFYPVTQTLGWEPSCDHNLAPVPGVVLDPFLGSGTTARVAQSLGRNWLGIELNPDYRNLQDDRVTQYGFQFA